MRPVGAKWYDKSMGNLTDDEMVRFNSKTLSDSVGCKVWQGPLDRDGYGQFYLRRKSRRAHRVAWYDWFGEIPAGYVVNHKCKNRACVNPQHLEMITARENALNDSVGIPALNARKTTCLRGHSFDKTYTNKTTGKVSRICSTCDAEKKRRLRQKWRAEDTLSV